MHLSANVLEVPKQIRMQILQGDLAPLEKFVGLAVELARGSQQTLRMVNQPPQTMLTIQQHLASAGHPKKLVEEQARAPVEPE
jgi:hypothetical protein